MENLEIEAEIGMTVLGFHAFADSIASIEIDDLNEYRSLRLREKLLETSTQEEKISYSSCILGDLF